MCLKGSKELILSLDSNNFELIDCVLWFRIKNGKKIFEAWEKLPKDSYTITNNKLVYYFDVPEKSEIQFAYDTKYKDLKSGKEFWTLDDFGEDSVPSDAKKLEGKNDITNNLVYTNSVKNYSNWYRKIINNFIY